MNARGALQGILGLLRAVTTTSHTASFEVIRLKRRVPAKTPKFPPAFELCEGYAYETAILFWARELSLGLQLFTVGSKVSQRGEGGLCRST